MSPEYVYGAARRDANASGEPRRPSDPRGRPATGHIAKILVGQGHGYIRLGDDREIYFHRGDSREGTAFNDLQIGDAVTFELLEDPVSGARALRVRVHSRIDRVEEAIGYVDTVDE
jgi:cold shock CspA family protein